MDFVVAEVLVTSVLEDCFFHFTIKLFLNVRIGGEEVAALAKKSNNIVDLENEPDTKFKIKLLKHSLISFNLNMSPLILIFKHPDHGCLKVSTFQVQIKLQELNPSSQTLQWIPMIEQYLGKAI